MIFFDHDESGMNFYDSDFSRFSLAEELHNHNNDLFSLEDIVNNYINNFEGGSTNNSREKIDIPKIEEKVNIENELDNINTIPQSSSNENKNRPNNSQILTSKNNNTINTPKVNIQASDNHLLSNKTKRSGETLNESNPYNKKQKCGRKTEKERAEVHDKFKADNIIRKIKVHVLQDAIRNLINVYLKKKIKNKELCKLLAKDIERLKKDENLKLMNLTLKDIYRIYPIGENYSYGKAKNNEMLIDEIYAKNDLIELQKLLNLTFLEFYEIYTNKVTGKELSEDLCNKIKDIELLNGTTFKGIEEYIEGLAAGEREKGISENDVNRYINEVKKNIGEYEEFFKKKKGRNTDK
jgi:hypothetical protein